MTEPIVQLAGDCRILVELPAVDNPAEAIKLVEQTGRLEFVDSGTDFYNEGAIIRTSGNPSPKVGAGGRCHSYRSSFRDGGAQHGRAVTNP